MMTFAALRQPRRGTRGALHGFAEQSRTLFSLIHNIK